MIYPHNGEIFLLVGPFVANFDYSNKSTHTSDLKYSERSRDRKKMTTTGIDWKTSAQDLFVKHSVMRLTAYFPCLGLLTL